MSSSCTNKELLARLVSFDTTSDRSTQDLFDFVCSYLERPGIRTERFDCGNGYENVWFECGPPCEHGEGIVLCGHVDTVPAEEPDWVSDPRELVERDGRLHARGACDMKGFDAIAINLLREAAENQPEHPVGLLLTHSEEIGTIGAGQFAEQWPKGRPFPEQVIVGEPTSLQPIRGHKGHLGIRLVVGGQPCHTGFPHEGVNAITAAVPLIQHVDGLRAEMAEERIPESSLFPEVPFSVLTIVRINGGNAINIMPEFCTIDIGVRLLPGQSSSEFLPRFRDVVEQSGLRIAAEAVPGTCTLELLNDTPSFGTDEDDAFLRSVMDVSGATEAFGVGYGTDAGRLAALGCRSVVFGPGNIAQAHKANEWMPLDEFERAPELLRTLIARTAE